MSLCLHVNLLFCSAQQHCPPAPSSLPTLVPPGRRFHHTRWPRHLFWCWSCSSFPPSSSSSSGWLNQPAILLPFHHWLLNFSSVRPGNLDDTFLKQDYFDIVKNPMDLSTIKRKLDTGQYQEPWQYVDDIWLMFNNAWLYNRKTSRVYKYCSKLAEVFETEIDPVMQNLGYCCGRKVRQQQMYLFVLSPWTSGLRQDKGYFGMFVRENQIVQLALWFTSLTTCKTTCLH